MNRRIAFPVGVASLALCGCAQLAGIDTASGKDRVDDSLTLQRVSVGAQVTAAPLDLTGLTASFLTPGGPVAATTTTPGEWSSTLTDPTPVQFTLPDLVTPDQPAIPRVISLPTQAIKTYFGELTHPAPAPAPSPSSLTFSVPLNAPLVTTDGFQTFVVGAWSKRPFATAELPAAGGTAIAVTVSYAGAANLSSEAGHVAITPDDALLVLRYTVNQLVGATEAQPFTQAATNTVSTPAMTTVTADQMLTASVDPTSLAARFSTVRPAVAGLTMNWSVSAAPGSAYGLTSGPTLQAGAIATTQTAVTASYGNPFLAKHAWPSTFVFIANESRAYTPPGSTLAMTLNAQLTQLAPAGTGLTLDAKAGFANTIKLGGTQLNVDGVAITRPTADVTVTFDTDDAIGDSYAVTLLDIVPNAAKSGLIGRQLINVAGDQPSLTLPAALFQTGHFYALRVFTDSGVFPHVATGDLQTLAPAFSQAFVDSAVFTVTP